jgi:6-hydroxytryprostatin B O-methyltransferase
MDSILDDITLSVTKIKYWLKANDLAQPSLDRSTAAKTLPPNAPDEIQVARQKLIEASYKLNQLALGPSEYLSTLAIGVSSVPKSS